MGLAGGLNLYQYASNPLGLSPKVLPDESYSLPRWCMSCRCV
ncbi:hypothetical protein WCT62_21590 [Pectobacterium parmentieri]|nr:hypothetical protein [Pectobacterium parmentieri]